MNDVSQIWLTVRTLGEFAFCPRAGILSALQEKTEEQEYDRPNLDFLPQYSLVVVEEQLALHLKKLGMWTAAAGLAITCGLLSLWFAWKFVVLGSAVLFFFVARSFRREFTTVLRLADTRRQAIQAKAAEPPQNLSETVAVNWWSLLKAGFDSIRLQETLRDEETKLVGKPWRTLRKGSILIPVIKLESANFEAGRFWVYPQHEVRLVAYAHLLAVCQGAEVPYAVALFGDSFDGVAIPVTKPMLDALPPLFDAARELILRNSAGLPSEPPKNLGVCVGCPFGSPELVTDRQTSGKKVNGVPARDGRAYHSQCGDRFAWTPPHRLAKKKGLLPPEV